MRKGQPSISQLLTTFPGATAGRVIVWFIVSLFVLGTTALLFEGGSQEILGVIAMAILFVFGMFAGASIGRNFYEETDEGE